jgi:hypothetical protein
MSLPRTAPRVVAAVSGDVQPRIRTLLPECELRFVRSGSELVRALDEARCALLIVQVHFDESAALAALRCVISCGQNFPVICVRDVACDKPGHAVLGSLRMALGGVTARQFIDLVEHRDDEAGNARVRGVLMQLLPAALSSS